MHTVAQEQYKKVDIVTADKGKLVVLLYDGAISFIQQAKGCAQVGDIEEKCNNLNRAYDIIQELHFSLDTEAGGELAQTLRRLYLFMNRQIVRAKVVQDGTKQMDDVIKMLKTLNEAWREITTNKGQDQLGAQAEQHAEPPRLAQDLTA
jgi:flagellar protein FliS